MPQPHIKIEQISFADPSGALHIDADYFKGNVRVLPLLVGRLEISSAILLKPRLIIDLDSKPLPDDSAIGRAAEAKPDSAEAAAADAARLGVVSLVNGMARLKSKSLPSDVMIDDIDMTLDWRNLNLPASLTGKARVRDQFADIAAWVGEPAQLLRGGRSQLTLEIKSDVLTLTTNGTLSMASKPEFSGHLRAASQALPKLLELIGYPIARTSALSRFRLSSEARGTLDGLSLSSLDLRLAENDFEGSLAIETGEEKPLLSGTLATDLLSFDPFFAHFQLLASRDDQWAREPLDFHTLTTANLDLRVSAARARLSHFEMQDAALSFMSHDNRIDLSVAQAKAYGGVFKARANVTIGLDGIDLHAATSVTDLDAGALSWSMADLPEVTGAATGNATIEAAGNTLASLIQHVDGRLQVKVKQGDVRGLDLNRLLHPANDPSSQRAADALSIHMPFDEAQLGVKILGGTAEVEQGLAKGPAGHLLLSGTVSLPERKFDLRAVALPIVPEDPGSEAAQNHSILIKGSWDHPLIAPAAP